MGNTWIADKVLDVLIANRNLEVRTEFLMAETGTSRDQVQGVLGNLRRRKGARIDTIVPGRVYIFRGFPEPSAKDTIPPAPVKETRPAIEHVQGPNKIQMNKSTGKFIMPRPDQDNVFFRVVGRTSNGVILEDSEHTLWRATPLD